MNHAKRIEKLEGQLRTGAALDREIEALWAELVTLTSMSETEQAEYLAKVEAEIFGGHNRERNL